MSDDMNDLQEYVDIDNENNRWMLFCGITAQIVMYYYSRYIERGQPYGYTRSGEQYIREILSGSEERCYRNLRMKQDIFISLCNYLRDSYGLQGTGGVSLYESVGMFIFVVGQGIGNRLVAELFGHSIETVNRHFHRVLKAVLRISGDIVKPHPNYNDGVRNHRPNNPDHACFRECIGAIDGTHVKATLPAAEEIPYIGRKGYATQNILAICDFNMCFTFGMSGWEGTTHDSRMLNVAISRPELNFPIPRNGKYYLVDAGFPHKTGYMGPYKGIDTRYHFQDFERAETEQGRTPRNAEEKFNKTHSSCRNIIERTFGVWKSRFHILEKMPRYKFGTQADIVIATLAVHNYLRAVDDADYAFTRVANVRHFDEQDDIEIEETNEESSVLLRTTRDWENIRRSITEEIWNN